MRLGIPDKVKIGGLVYDCRAAPNLARDSHSMGRGCANALQIEIDASLPQQNRESTLLHEIIEQINYCHELGLEHCQIMTLEAALYQVLQDNPAVFGPGPDTP